MILKVIYFHLRDLQLLMYQTTVYEVSCLLCSRPSSLFLVSPLNVIELLISCLKIPSLLSRYRTPWYRVKVNLFLLLPCKSLLQSYFPITIHYPVLKISRVHNPLRGPSHLLTRSTSLQVTVFSYRVVVLH